MRVCHGVFHTARHLRRSKSKAEWLRRPTAPERQGRRGKLGFSGRKRAHARAAVGCGVGPMVGAVPGGLEPGVWNRVRGRIGEGCKIGWVFALGWVGFWDERVGFWDGLERCQIGWVFALGWMDWILGWIGLGWVWAFGMDALLGTASFASSLGRRG